MARTAQSTTALGWRRRPKPRGRGRAPIVGSRPAGLHSRVLGSAPVIAFVGTADPGRARAFYEDVLGLRLVGDDPAALTFDAHGVTLRVSKVPRVEPAPYTVLGWSVPDVRATVDALAAKGVVLERYAGLPQDERAVWTSPGGAQVAWFKDPDGNLLSVTQV